MKKSVLRLMVALLAMSCLLTSCGKTDSEAEPNAGEANKPAANEEVYTIKLAHGVSESGPLHLAALVFEERVERESNGKIQVEISPNSALGNDKQMAEMIQMGTLDCGVIPTAKLSGFYAPLQVLDLPFLFVDKEASYEVFDSDEFLSLFEEDMRNIGFEFLGIWESGFKQITSNRMIKTPEDFKGLNVRVMESALLTAQYKALNANPVTIDFGETYNALQQGTADAEENPLTSIVNMKFYEVQETMTISNHGYLACAFLFSTNVWEKLPEEYRTLLADAARDVAEDSRTLNATSEEEYIKIIEDYGTEIYTLNEEEIAAFVEVMLPVHEEFRDVIGSDILDTTKELLEEAMA
ncbi:TRAP transporter substrate-binding protein [Dysosmobacter sp. Marseille-Q4140]|nr:TRAP transporter substrate-binding protein [Dysosmobacter sp. Marseille-Q4140]